VDDTKKQDFEIINDSVDPNEEGNLVVHSIEIVSVDPDIFVLEKNLDDEIRVLTSTSYQNAVIFEPKEVKTYSAILRISQSACFSQFHDISPEGVIDFPLSGIGGAPLLVVTPDPIDFKDVNCGQTVSMLVQLSNGGDVGLKMCGAEITDEAISRISIVDYANAFSAEIPQGEKVSIRINYDSSIEGDYETEVVFCSNDPLYPKKHVKFIAHTNECNDPLR